MKQSFASTGPSSSSSRVGEVVAVTETPEPMPSPTPAAAALVEHDPQTAVVLVEHNPQVGDEADQDRTPKACGARASKLVAKTLVVKDLLVECIRHQ